MGAAVRFRFHGGQNKTRIIAALESKQVTEKTLAIGLSEAVNQHDAEAAKEESATAGRGTHVREVRQDGRLWMRSGVLACQTKLICVTFTSVKDAYKEAL